VGLLRNKILIIAGLLVLIGGSVWIFVWFSGSKPAMGPGIKAVPVNAFCVFESQQARNTWKKFAQGNILWETLRQTNTINTFSVNAAAVDSLLGANADVAALLEGNPGWFSLHCTGNDQVSWFFAAGLPRIGDESSVREFITKAAKQKPQEFVFHKTTTYRFSGWSYALYEGIFICSDNSSLLEASIEQLEKGESLLKDKIFVKVRETAGEKADGNLYVHYDRLPLFFKRISNDASHDALERIGYFASWTETDLAVKSNAILFNGFTATSDSSRNYLTLFKNQKPQRVEMPAILPASTTNMLHFGFGSFATYFNDYKNWLERHNLGGDRSSSIMAANAQYRINVEEYMSNWVGNEMALVTLGGNAPLQERSFGVVSASNVQLAREQLGKLKYITDYIDRQATSHDDMLPDTSFYNGYSIRRIGILHLVPLMYGNVFDQLDRTFYTIVGHYVVFGNSPDALKTFLISYENGKTLATDRFYTDFASSLSSESNVFVYTAIGRSKPVYKNYASATVGAELEKHDEMMQQLEAFGLQFSSGNGLFYTNAFVRRNNTETKQEAGSLWEQALDTTFHTRPQLVVNHNSKTLDIFVQDDANTIYLISSTGTTWWKRKLPGPLLGDVQQVDALKNGKLQLVCNTANAIYVIDRNGNDLAPFPLKLPANASNAVQVFDYDNNRDYRLLVACTDKKIYNYTIKGKAVEGWKTEPTVEIVSAPVQHTVIANKDYVLFADRSGRLYATDRQGRTRLVLKQRLPAPLRRFVLETGKDLARSYVVSADSLGVFTRISLTDIPDNSSFTGFGKFPEFDYRDFNDDGVPEFILGDTARVAVFTQDKKALVNFVFERAAAGQTLFFRFGEKDNRIGRVCPGSGEIFLINSAGVPADGFPLIGETLFSIGNLNNDGHLVLVCGGKGRYLYAYPVK
jgi:hypothetical protein